MSCMHNPSRTGIFVLNLDRSADRMEWMTSQLAAFGMRYHRVAAIDGERADLDAAMRSLGVSLGIPKGRPLVKSEIACYLTHLTAVRLAIAQDCRAALILEDDAEILADLTPVLESFAEFDDKPYVLRLEPWHKAHWQVAAAKFTGVDAVYTPDTLWFSTAYCITQTAAKQLVGRLTELCSPFDREIFSYPRAGLTVLMSSPALATPSKRFQSLIQTERKALKSMSQSPLKALRRQLRRRHDMLIGFTRIFHAAFQTASQFSVGSIVRLRLRPNHSLSQANMPTREQASP